MTFIGQVALDPQLFPNGAGKVAYAFITDDEDIDTWGSDFGESAVIVQPSDHVPEVLTQAVAIGPTSVEPEEPEDAEVLAERLARQARAENLLERDKQRWMAQLKLDDPEQHARILEGEARVAQLMAESAADDDEAAQRARDEAVELLVELTYREDPDFVPEGQGNDEYWEALEGDKIGGTPLFIQADEFPDDTHRWLLLFQLSDNELNINFGTGVGYAFVDEDCRMGRLLWQC